ncbi:STAS domain-containing protein [Jannaschia pagri]|uniref:STAS domain-containing protein n=1 Tax=Jannaschia TaxID=188905 RepID=UPI001C7DA4FA
MVLPPRVDIASAGDVRTWFLDLTTDARLDASSVEVVTTPGLQVLMAGRDHLNRQSLRLTIDAPSAAFLSCLQALGTPLVRLTSDCQSETA